MFLRESKVLYLFSFGRWIYNLNNSSGICVSLNFGFVELFKKERCASDVYVVSCLYIFIFRHGWLVMEDTIQTAHELAKRLWIFVYISLVVLLLHQFVRGSINESEHSETLAPLDHLDAVLGVPELISRYK